MENLFHPFVLRINAPNNAIPDPPLLAKKVFRSRGEDLDCIYFKYILGLLGGAFMTVAKIFKSGNSQAVRLPKEFRFDVKEVEIFRRGDEVVLRKRKRNLKRALAILRSLPDDFMADGREDLPPQEREPL